MSPSQGHDIQERENRVRRENQMRVSRFPWFRGFDVWDVNVSTIRVGFGMGSIVIMIMTLGDLGCWEWRVC